MAQTSRLIEDLRSIVGARYVLTGGEETRRYRTGYRYGSGRALAVVRPGTLLEQWRVVKACVAANVIVIMQAANTGLTGGSTPYGDDYDRAVVIISTRRITGIHLIDAGRQVICLGGSTLDELERALQPIGREPHSVIGSSCVGASVLGGVCNNSGGALVRRGPAFTEMALFAQLDPAGELRLVNHLGVNLGTEPESILQRLEARAYGERDIEYDPARRISARDYLQRVRDVDADTPARFNADATHLFEASGSAGRLILFAVRLETFASESATVLFYVGSNDTAELTRLRRHMLSTFTELPVAAEYLHRTAFDISAAYGKDMFLAIRYLGTGRLPQLLRLKAHLDALGDRWGITGPGFSDRLLQAIGRLFPTHLPRRLREYRERYQHHLMLQMSGNGIAEARTYLAAIYPSAAGAFFECTPDEAARAFLHRFVTAGAAVRYRVLHAAEVESLISLDVALRRNERQWFETLPPEIEAALVHKIYYGHFFCHVFHQDYIVAKGHDARALEHHMRELLDRRGAEYPAEHNVGHLYPAKPGLAAFYRALDPRNQFNPGIGCTSSHQGWRESGGAGERSG